MVILYLSRRQSVELQQQCWYPHTDGADTARKMSSGFREGRTILKRVVRCAGGGQYVLAWYTILKLEWRLTD